MKMRRRKGWDLAREQCVKKARGPLMGPPGKHVVTVIPGLGKDNSLTGVHRVLLGSSTPGRSSVPCVAWAEHWHICPQLGLLRTQPAPSGIDTPGWEASLGLGRQPDGLQSICLRQLGSRARALLTPSPPLQTRRGAAATSRISLPPRPLRSATCFYQYQG